MALVMMIDGVQSDVIPCEESRVSGKFRLRGRRSTGGQEGKRVNLSIGFVNCRDVVGRGAFAVIGHVAVNLAVDAERGVQFLDLAVRVWCLSPHFKHLGVKLQCCSAVWLN
ncbi:hypothetical protein TNCV_1784521 [Trichonephila clavipes]|nr:hypothetical protein TNCV_1784521 [Trichonephila clavipes]